ncbi:SIMPL domain-containing protein [Candidatus Gracilibacteria bacterium]|nr:SIMPL domain-containing protein [Candidatus Gracilibacteria bacterium]
MNNALSALIVGIAIVLASWVIGQNINHTANITNGNQNSISVNGDGKVFAKPDTFLLTVVAQEKSKTTKEGFAQVAAKIGEVQKLLKDNGIEEKDIQSVNISINPNYNYDNGKSTIDGFMATHGLQVKIRNLESIDTILAGVSTIANVQIQNTAYDIDDKTKLYTEARNLAIAKAKQKAEDMAKASGINLGKVVTISESQGYVQPMYANQYAKSEMANDAMGGGTVSVGQLEISTNVSISYEIR